jgi:hypothetical protein
VVVDPLLVIVGVIVNTDPTFPETELGDMLIVGSPSPIVIVIVAVLVPAEFVAVTE